MKTAKKYRIVFTVLTIILSALFATTCLSPLEELQTPQEKKQDYPPGYGAIQLNFGNTSRQTIMSDIPLSSLIYAIEITQTDDLLVKSLDGLNLSEAQEDIILNVGNYYVYVFAYTPGKTKNEAAYFGGGKQNPIEVTALTGTSVEIDIKGYTESDVKGTFTYSLISPTIPDRSSSRPSQIIITPYFTGKGSQERTVDLTYTDFTATGIYSDLVGEELLPGYYSVLVIWRKTDHETGRVRFILHIFPTLTSHLEYTLPSLTKTGNLEVIFDAKGGNFSGAPTMTVYAGVGTTITAPSPSPTRIGHTFNDGVVDGVWYKDSDCTVEWNWTDQVWTDMTLYAKWTKNPIVTYHGNAPSTADDTVKNVPAPFDVPYGSKLTRPAPSPTLTGHTLYTENTNDQWYTDPDIWNATTRWSFTDNEVTGDIDLYARWTINTYTVIFHANHSESTWSVTLNNVPYNTQLVEPTIPAGEMRTGYKLTGWRDGAADIWVFESDRVKKNLTLNAQWEKEEDNEIGGDITVDTDDDFTVVLGKDAWSHGFRITINNSVNGEPPFTWKITAGGYEYLIPGDTSQLRLEGVGDFKNTSTTVNPADEIRIDSRPSWWNESNNGPWDPGTVRYYVAPNMVWLYENGLNPIIITVEFGDRSVGGSPPYPRKTLTFEITFKPQ